MGYHAYHQLDRNQKEIVDFFKACGCQILSLSRLGAGCPDLLIEYRGKLALVEVKMANGKLTEKQTRFVQTWPVQVVRDFADCTDLLESLDSKQR